MNENRMQKCPEEEKNIIGMCANLQPFHLFISSVYGVRHSPLSSIHVLTHSLKRSHYSQFTCVAAKHENKKSKSTLIHLFCIFQFCFSYFIFVLYPHSKMYTDCIFDLQCSYNVCILLLCISHTLQNATDEKRTNFRPITELC